MEECSFLKMTDTGGNGRMECQVYKESYGVNVVQETNFYVKG